MPRMKIATREKKLSSFVDGVDNARAAEGKENGER